MSSEPLPLSVSAAIVGEPGSVSTCSVFGRMLAGRFAPCAVAASRSSTRASRPARPGPRALTGAVAISIDRSSARPRRQGRAFGFTLARVMFFFIESGLRSGITGR